MNRNALKGAAIVGAVSAMLATGFAHAGGKGDKAGGGAVKCQGANDCKGKGACKGAKNDCKGQNACKGQSFTHEKTEKECRDKGGKPAK